MRKHCVGPEVNLVIVIRANGHMGKQVLDDLGLDLRLRSCLLAPVVDLQFSAIKNVQQFLGQFFDSLPIAFGL